MTDCDLEEAIIYILFDNPPDIKVFKKILDKILTNIENVRKIQMLNLTFGKLIQDGYIRKYREIFLG